MSNSLSGVEVADILDCIGSFVDTVEEGCAMTKRGAHIDSKTVDELDKIQQRISQIAQLDDN